MLLDDNRNGVDQISETLSAFDNVDAVHILSHGNDGSVKLGNTWLSDSNIDEYSNSINVWGNSLDENADILIYGCNLAESESGEQFVEQLAFLTGADIAASKDITGSALFGGNWDLEYKTGAIESQTAISAALQQSYASVLATETVADNFSSGDFTGSTGSQSWTGNWIETDSSGAGAGNGSIKVASGELRVQADTVNDNIYREVDLSNALSASFSFTYANSIVPASETIVVQVSGDGGTSYTTLVTFDNITNTGTGSKYV